MDFPTCMHFVWFYISLYEARAIYYVFIKYTFIYSEV